MMRGFYLTDADGNEHEYKVVNPLSEEDGEDVMVALFELLGPQFAEKIGTLQPVIEKVASFSELLDNARVLIPFGRELLLDPRSIRTIKDPVWNKLLETCARDGVPLTKGGRAAAYRGNLQEKLKAAGMCVWGNGLLPALPTVEDSPDESPNSETSPSPEESRDDT